MKKIKDFVNTNNRLFKIISIVLALLLWLYVNHQENPVTEQIFTVPLEVRGLETKLTISDRPSYVKVRLSGQQRYLDELTTRDLEAFLEMSDLEIGQHSLEVHVSVPDNTQLVSVTPGIVNLNVEMLATAQYPVNISFRDSTPGIGYLALKPVVTPTQVLLSGPEDKLKEVKQVYVEVDLGDLTFNYHQKLPVKVEDQNGDLLLEWITATPSHVDVLIPVVPEIPLKTVPVKTSTSGSPGDGFAINRIVVEPEIMSILGEQSLLNDIEAISTDPVDIEGATQDVVERVNLRIPKGVKIEGEYNQVTVVVGIEKKLDRSFSGLLVTGKNLSPGLTVEFSLPRSDVIVRGGSSLIERILIGDMEVFVDLANLPPGEHLVKPQVNLPQGVTLVEIKPREMTVLIK